MQPHFQETQGSGSGMILEKNKGATDAMRFPRRGEVYEKKRKEKKQKQARWSNGSVAILEELTARFYGLGGSEAGNQRAGYVYGFFIIIIMKCILRSESMGK